MEYEITEKGKNFLLLYEIKEINKWILVISALNLILNLIEKLIKLI